ncbi:MAG TPA: cation diffusion facilitator family transporter [Fimbriimonadaceae bacterium]|nr:cation diffusion facilitator family transporter [Fimbriimonadaceae bacterium]
MTADSRAALVRRAATVSFASTVVVVVAKLAAAAVSGSVSVLAEGLQSLLDVFMSLAVVWSLRVAAAPPDEDHPFGHGKAELLTSAFQMLLVLGTAAVIVWQAAERLMAPHTIEPDWGIAAMAYAAVANTCVIVYVQSVLRRAHSHALAGEREHLKSDTFASVGILGGLLLYRATGWAPLDPIVALLFTGMGAYFAVRQLRRVVHPLMDGALPRQDIERIEQVLKAHGDVRGFHNVQTRETGVMRYVSLHVMLDDDLTFVRAHDLAEAIEDELSAALSGAHVTLHYEPFEAELEHREREHHEPRP